MEAKTAEGARREYYDALPRIGWICGYQFTYDQWAIGFYWDRIPFDQLEPGQIVYRRKTAITVNPRVFKGVWWAVKELRRAVRISLW